MIRVGCIGSQAFVLIRELRLARRHSPTRRHGIIPGLRDGHESVGASSAGNRLAGRGRRRAGRGDPITTTPQGGLELRAAAPYNRHMSSEENPRRDSGTAVAEASPQVKQPPLFQVILLNDDYTPMEFVVDVLERFFSMSRTNATRVMLEVHTKGKGVCGVFTYEIAETKVAQVTTYARDHQHPLMCTLEQA
jgi:ATP-dependent Clp protease adaptor protein ClpS